LPNWKQAESDCANLDNIEPVMAQKRIDYSKFTQSNGTVLVLALWASLMLHLVTGSNLDKVGLTNPVKVKPAGGTVRVVDLTPAEQTRVPEAAKSRPLPIAPTPVNPEVATRTPRNISSPRNPGAFNFAPPSNRPQLPPPSSQVPSNQPVVPTNPNSKKPELSDNSRKKPSSQEDGSEINGGDPAGGGLRRKKKGAETDKDDKSQVEIPKLSQYNNQQNTDEEERKKKEKIEQERITREIEEKKRIEQKNKNQDPFVKEEKELNSEVTPILRDLSKKNGNPTELIVPKSFSAISSCKKYKPFVAFWITTKDIPEPYFRLSFKPDANQKVNEKYYELGNKIAQDHYQQFRDKNKSFTWYPFKLPDC
jgi:hypothetical protein